VLAAENPKCGSIYHDAVDEDGYDSNLGRKGFGKLGIRSIHGCLDYFSMSWYYRKPQGA
jgi:hypothetical protein